jgi:serine/threonine protein kinase
VTTVREAMLLRELHHPNVLRLDSAFVSNTSGSDFIVSLIFEFVDHDLHEMMQCQKGYGRFGQQRQPVQHFPAEMVRSLFWQLLCGLDYLHRNWIIHRDLKPSNLLVSAIDAEDPGLRRRALSSEKQHPENPACFTQNQKCRCHQILPCTLWDWSMHHIALCFIINGPPTEQIFHRLTLRSAHV